MNKKKTKYTAMPEDVRYAMLKYRTKNKVTQSELARLVSLSLNAISNAERGKSVMPTTEFIIKDFLKEKGYYPAQKNIIAPKEKANEIENEEKTELYRKSITRAETFEKVQDKLIELRFQKGLLIKEVASLLGVSGSTISRIVNGNEHAFSFTKATINKIVQSLTNIGLWDDEKANFIKNQPQTELAKTDSDAQQILSKVAERIRNSKLLSYNLIGILAVVQKRTGSLAGAVINKDEDEILLEIGGVAEVLIAMCEKLNFDFDFCLEYYLEETTEGATK